MCSKHLASKHIDRIALYQKKIVSPLLHLILRSTDYFNTIESINLRGNIMKRLAILFGIMILSVLSACAADQNPTLTIVGEGTVTVPADTTIITVSAESSNQNVTLATSDVQDKLNRARDALIAAGVKSEEILSGQSSGTSSYQSSSRVCRIVNNTTVCDVTTSAANKVTKSFSVQIKTTDQSRINGIIDTAKSAGASASITGYSLSDSSSAVSDARKKAVENARVNAEGMAGAAGARIGKVLDISEYAYPDIGMAEPSGYGGPGTVDVTSYVRVTYEIL